jgi:RNA polymerase sigma factor (sigma-70 family)
MARDGVIGFIRRLAPASEFERATDGELLALFVGGRNEAAFEALVARYAGLVRSVVARVLTDPADIDYATQATFLVLVRRAGRSDWRAGVGPWLYGVAHRVALKLRARNRRQPGPLGAHEPAAPAHPPDPSWREACDRLHAELDRLPDRYRLPLLLCYLEGYTRDQAVAALGLTVGAVKGRGRRGCELLRHRLARRGVSLSVGLLAAVTPRPALAARSDAEIAAAILGATPPRVVELVREVTRTVSSTMNKAVVTGLVAAVLVAVAGLSVGYNSDPPHRLVPVAGPVPRDPPRPTTILVRFPDKRGCISYLEADGKE